MRVLDSIDDAALDELAARREFFWLDLVRPRDDELDALAERFGWHPLAVEDTREFRQRPKLDRYGDQMLLVFYGVQPDRAHPRLLEVHLLVSGDWVVTIRRRASDELDELRRTQAARDGEREVSVVYEILDTLTDSFLPALQQIDDAIDELEDAILLAPTDAQLQQVFQLKRRLLMLRRVVTPQRDLAARTIDEIEDLPGLDVGQRDWFRDVYDHLIRVSDTVDSYRDLLTGVMDVYLSTTSNRMNAVMKQLTVVSTIFLPITALTGFYGQNFGWLVRHVGSFAAFATLGLGGILASCLILFVWFRRARFF